MHDTDSECLHLYTDATGGIGFGAYFSGHWVCAAWPDTWSEFQSNITFLELVPMAIALCTWGHDLVNRMVMFHCDNQAAVAILNKQSAKVHCSHGCYA